MKRIFDLIPYVIGLASLLIAILTYLRVSRKYASKIFRFEFGLHPNEDCLILGAEGSGSFQRLEILIKGTPNSKMTLLVDNKTCWDESFTELFERGSKFIRVFNTSKEIYAAEVDLPKNFYQNLRLLIKNVDDNKFMTVQGTVHYSIHENGPFFAHLLLKITMYAFCM